MVLAEDNDDHAVLIRMALERASKIPVEVRRARNGEEAIELVEAQPPDLLLLDLKMPGRSGHEVLERIKGDDRTRRIPVAVFDLVRPGRRRGEELRARGNHFITKPEDPAELEKRLRSLLNNLSELRGITRGSGVLAATAQSVMHPGSLAMRRAVAWGMAAAILVGLLIFAFVTGVMG